jgi:hypothetical protein
MKEQKSILPSSFTKKYKNAKLNEILSDDMNWGMRDLGYSAKGRRELIQINSLLFDYIETLTDDIDFYLEPFFYIIAIVYRTCLKIGDIDAFKF